jgi:hypothetical protein
VAPVASGEREARLALDVEAIQVRANEMVDYLVAQWVTASKDKAVADNLAQTGEHEAFVWRRFREGLEMNAV